MGVPVLTIFGDIFNSRCGYSINKNLGLDEFIAKSNIRKSLKIGNKSNAKIKISILGNFS